MPIVQNVALAFFAILAFWLLVEVIFRMQLHRIPLGFQAHIGGCTRYLAQSSKRNRNPVNYIALLGDSYAQGYGDWLLSAASRGNPQYGVHHVLHREMGRDVISLGKGGAGSFSGMVHRPINALNCLHAQHGLEPPDLIVVLFYAGNDLENNLDNLRHLPQRFENVLGSYDRFRILADSRIRKNAKWSFLYPHSLRFFYNLAVSIFKAGDNEVPGKPWSMGETNRSVVGNEIALMPDRLQAPALELDEAETSQALLLFDYSLRYLADYYLDSRVLVVYVPTPLESYALASDMVSTQPYYERAEYYESRQLQQRSDYLGGRIAEICSRQKVEFLDAREDIRGVARNHFVHGPLDWKHFNELGYTALGEGIARYLSGDG